MPKPRLYLFPGMGADQRLIEPQRAIECVDVIAPNWVSHQPDDSLASYAKRQAASLDQSRPFYLGGISFGGMVACEVATHCGPNLRGLVLISTCRSNRGIPMLSRIAGNVVAPLLPHFAIRAGKSMVPMFRKRFGVVTPEQGVLFDAMLKATDPAFLKWALRALLAWSGHSDVCDVPVLQVHGEKDRVLPARLTSSACIVPGSGHVMNLTHRDEVNHLINRWIEARMEADGHSIVVPLDPALARIGEGAIMKIIVERHPDGFIAYPLGMKGVVIAQGDSYDEALAEVTSAIRFHIETFGPAVLEDESPVLEAFIAEAQVA